MVVPVGLFVLATLEADCDIRFLVEKKTISACFYIHTAADSAWSYAVHVVKNALATPFQAQKNNAIAQRRPILLLSCGTL